VQKCVRQSKHLVFLIPSSAWSHGKAWQGIICLLLSGKWLQLKHLEERAEKIRDEVRNAEAAREELACLRTEVRELVNQKGDLENRVRGLQKEELSIRVLSFLLSICASG
jgi:uncharacterized protein YlxW (UPF0749 family)